MKKLFWLRKHKVTFNLKVLIIFAITSLASAQNRDFGKITVKDLQEKIYVADTSAPAAILVNKCRSHFVYNDKKGFSMVHDYEIRIKIYKKEGLKFADWQVPHYVGYESLNKDMVQFSSATTYNLENNAIAKTKLNSEGRFKKSVNEFWNEAAITMPNVKVGSIIEFKYTLKTENILEFPKFNFQYEIPVAYAEYKTEIPQFYIYKPLLLGLRKVKSESKVANGFQNYSNEHSQSENLTYQQINSIYTDENIPALKEEPYVDNLENYRSAVIHELEKIQYPDAPEKNFSTTWQGVAATIYKDKDFGQELNERSYFEPFLIPIVKNATTDFEKATAIFEFVKRTMNWDGKFGYSARKGVRKAFDDKTGNVAEINFILISMLNYSGIITSPVLVSTVNNGIPVFPNVTVFNYVVAAAQIDGKQVLMDATDKNSNFNILPARTLNWTGRLIRRDGTSEEIKLIPETASRKVVNVLAKINADGKISGKTRIQKTDYEALLHRTNHGNQNETDYVEKLEHRFNEIQVSEYKIENAADASKPIVESFSFFSDRDVEGIGDKIYINPLLFFTESQNPFVLDKREMPVYYGFPYQTKYIVNLEIPEGYAVESMPKAISLTTGENAANFIFNISLSGNKIQLTASKEINSGLIAAGFYDYLKEFYQKMISKQTEKIVLKKV